MTGKSVPESSGTGWRRRQVSRTGDTGGVAIIVSRQGPRKNGTSAAKQDYNGMRKAAKGFTRPDKSTRHRERSGTPDVYARPACQAPFEPIKPLTNRKKGGGSIPATTGA